jgi:hypothetical protein
MRRIRIASAERPISPRAYPRAGRQGAKAGTRERVPTVLGELSRRVARWALAPRRAKAGPSQTARPVHTHAQGLVVSIGRRGVHVSGSLRSSRAESLLRLISFSRAGCRSDPVSREALLRGCKHPSSELQKETLAAQGSKRRRRSKPKSRHERSFGEETPGRPSAL